MKSKKERTKILSLRLKPEEHRWLVAEAEAEYLPLSAYLRQKLFGRQVTSEKPRLANQKKGQR